MPLVLTTHAEKVTFLTKFLKNQNPPYSRNTLLMIRGPGANGKSIVLSEVLETTPVNVVIISENRLTFRPAATGPSTECAYLLVCNSSEEDIAFAAYLHANVVEFQSDPAYARSLSESLYENQLKMDFV